MGFQCTQDIQIDFMTIFVYRNTLRWDEIDFLEVKDTLLTVAPPGAMATIITLDSHTPLKQ